LIGLIIGWSALAWAVNYLLESSYILGTIIILIAIVVIFYIPKLIKWLSEKKQQISEGFDLLDIFKIQKRKLRKTLKIVWRITKSGLLIYFGVYTAISCLYFALQPHVLYQPSRDLQATPLDIGLSYDEVSFTTSDGVELSGWYVPGNSSKGIILFCHGNAGNIGGRLEYLKIFHRLGFDTFIFDYRGFGRSEGETTEKGTYRDIEAAMDHLIKNRNVSKDELIIYGRSLGGAIAIHHARYHTPKMLIIDSSFTSYRKISTEVLSGFLLPIPVKWLARFDYNSINDIGKIDCPVLVIHSSDDEMIPYSHGKELYKNANEPKRFITISGTHNEGFLTSENYENGLSDFLEKYL